MKIKFIYFVYGALFSLTSILGYQLITNVPSRSYEFTDDVSGAQSFKQLLDEKNILYDYKIDFLDRIWITPKLRTESMYNELEKSMRSPESKENHISKGQSD